MIYDSKLPTAEFKGHDNVMEFVSEIFINVNIYIAFKIVLHDVLTFILVLLNKWMPVGNVIITSGNEHKQKLSHSPLEPVGRWFPTEQLFWHTSLDSKENTFSIIFF